MLVALSKEVIETLTKVDVLQEQRDNAGAIQATADELQKVQRIAQQIAAILPLLRQRLPAQDVQRFDIAVSRLLYELRKSQQAFEQNRNQGKALSNLTDKMQSLVKDLSGYWRTFAEQQTKQSFELLNLIRHLPEVQDEQAQLTNLQNRLTVFFERVPTTSANLTDFDQALQELKHRLSNITGLNEAVRQFLQKTLTGQATLADMTDEVLDWCRQGKRASAFAIQFVQ